jgi:hypothetical protein
MSCKANAEDQRLYDSMNDINVRNAKTLKKSCEMPRIDPCVKLNLSFPATRRDLVRILHRKG